MSSFSPPIYNSDIFDSGLFNTGDELLNLADADDRYLKLSGGTVRGLTNFIGGLNVVGSLTLNGESLDLSLISGVVPGTPQNSKALSLDSSGQINGDLTLTGSLAATNLTGTIQTASQPNITSLGTLSSLTSSGLISNSILNNTTSFTTYWQATNSLGSPITTRLYMSNVGATFGVSTAHPLRFMTNNAQRMFISDTGLIGINLTSTTFQLDVNGSFNATSYNLAGVSVLASALTGITLGTAAGSKALVMSPGNNIIGINSLTATNLTGTIQTAAQPNITSLGTLTSLSISGSLSASTLTGTIQTAAQPNITSLGTLTSINSAAYSLSGASMLTSALTGLTAGTVSANKAVVVNSSGLATFGTGSTTTNNFTFYGQTANKELFSLFRDSDDSGLTIGSTAQTIQKSNYILNLSSGYNIPGGVVGTSSAQTIEVIRSNIKLVGLSDDYRFSIATSFLQATQPFGGNSYTQMNTSAENINLVCNTSTVSSVVSSNNLLLTNTGRLFFNTSTVFRNFRFTCNGSASFIGSTGFVDGITQPIASFRDQAGTREAVIAVQPSGTTFIGTRTSGSDMYLMTGNTGRIYIGSTGNVGINNANDRCPFEVSGSQNIVFGFGGSASLWGYNVQNNTWSSFGLGPINASINSYFDGNIFVRSQIFTTSDRRLKNEVAELDMPFDYYQKLRPVIYNWKNGTKENGMWQNKYGLMAQECAQVAGEMIGFLPNQNMKKEQEDDLEGVQLTIDYQQLAVLNCAIIKKLIKEIENLKKRIKKKDD